ncbi:uncharacterized protein LOC121376202 [Gigantopelta aegis]|uniref:uncharacterized protein LOC121376202 n=1 Tax=Gigantopelta aegis TaxID=1735272 RepID=UPI001B8876DB|nr:uncharacterized protein LOC121376202 [Gigantopelta aegis]
MTVDNDSTLVTTLLENNCRPTWPAWTCIFCNVCGLTSTAMWFLVLLPQVWKNFRRKSVAGLSPLWATANFSASLTNFFFVYLYAKIPLYGKINSVYMPILEFTLLVQFLIYGNFKREIKVAYFVFCVCLWTTIVTLQLVLRQFDNMQWLAITLWSVETFPQVLLNLKLKSASGLSKKSVIIATIGKTTDFLANYGLVVPVQYVVMIYFSSSVAYFNSILVTWYHHGSSSVARCIKAAIISTLTLFLAGFAVGLGLNTESYYSVLGPLSIIIVIGGGYTYFNYCRQVDGDSEDKTDAGHHVSEENDQKVFSITGQMDYTTKL